MTRPRKHRILLEAVLSFLFFVVAITTAVVPDWLERIVGIQPDSGRGEAEWLIAGALFLLAALSAVDVIGMVKQVRRAADRFADDSSVA